MNREIKFRGKSLLLDLGGTQWVYGSLVIKGGIPFIYEDKNDGTYNLHQVVKETVGQYTGIKDKNGIEIYEGDILIRKDCGNDERMVACIWNDENYGFEFFDEKNPKTMYFSIPQTFEIIGNIFDNKELIEKCY